MFRFINFSRYLFLTLVFVFICFSVFGLERPDDIKTTDTVDRGKALLYLMEGKYRQVKTFFGEFKQKKVSELLLYEVDSKGRFWYEKPGKFRCEYLAPYEQVNLLLDDVAYVYNYRLYQKFIELSKEIAP